MCESVIESKKLNIDWGKFKSGAKGKHLDNSKNAYIEFCKMLDETDFELVGDYMGNKEKVELVYRLDNNLKLNMRPNSFKKQTYKSVTNFKNELAENSDELIGFVGLSEGRSLIAKIKTFDDGIIEIDTNIYSGFNKGRQEFYSKLREVGGYTKDCYKGAEVKMNIFVDNIKLNTSPHRFKRQTYRAINNFKNNLKNNYDVFVKFIGLTNKNNLTVQIKTYDGGIVRIDMASYNKFTDGRKDTYDYCKSKNYKILSPYTGVHDKILIDFNCGHKSNWITPNSLKSGVGCPVCNESKGEKTIREHLKNNNISFIQEYRFDNCKYKNQLPFDFYIPEYNLCIEFDGEQHFEAFEYFGGEERFKIIQIRDNIKNNYCKENNINLLRIPYWELNNIEKILDEEFCKLKKLREIA